MKRAVVVGKQIYLRPMELEDIERGYHDWINDYEVSRGLLSPLPQTKEALAAYVERSRQADCVIFAVCDKETDTFIGTTRLSSIDWIHRNSVYGGMIGPAEFRGRGFGLDMWTQLFKYGFESLGLNRLWTTVSAENEASLSVHRKISGLKEEGRLKEHVFKQGRFIDCIVFGIIRSDFTPEY